MKNVIKKILKAENQIVLIYLILGILWIIFTDRILDALIANKNVDLINTYHSIKGIFFIIITSIILFYLVKSHINKIKFSEEKFRLLSENASDIIWLFDTTSMKFTYISPSIYKIQGYTSQEAMNLSLEELLTPESVKIVIDSIRIALDQNNNNELDFKKNRVFETNGKCKDGRIIHCEVNLSFIPDTKGKLKSIQGITRDITDWKIAEKVRHTHLQFFENMDQINRAIQGVSNLEKMMSNFLETTLSIFDCDRAWLFYPCDPDSSTFRVPMEKTKPEYPGAMILNVDLPMPYDMAQNLKEALESGVPTTYTIGTDKPINSVSANQFGVKSQMLIPIYPNVGKPWVFGIHQCSNARIWTSEESNLFLEISRRLADSLTSFLTMIDLQESELKFKTILYGSPIPQFVINREHQVIFWNKALEETTGIKAEEIIGTYRHWQAFYKEERSCLADLLVEENIDTIPELYFEKYSKSKIITGAYEALDFFPNLGVGGKWLFFTTIAIRDSKGNIIGAVETLEDITEQKLAELEITRMNRALRMLSDINQALIHLTDENILLNEVCNIAVNVGGYRLVWVGFADHDEKKTLRPVAFAGNDSEYIQSAKVSWGDNERGRGPGGNSIRSGQPCIVRNIISDPSFEPWREAAVKYGFNSIIALPLISENQTFGAMGIYSVETDAFDTKEVEILKELAADLAYGINTLRIKENKNQAEKALLRSETSLKEAQHLAMIGSWEWNLQTNQIWWSDETYHIFGVSKQTFIPDFETNGKFIHPDDFIYYCQSFEHSIQTGEPLDVELKLLSNDGLLKYCHAKGKIFYNDSGQPYSFLGTIMDITDRKRIEMEIRRMNRDLRMLSDSNQALIHSNDELSLLDEICRIGVEVGSYSLVWIGFKEYDEAYSIKPLAFAGAESKDYVESLNLTYADTERGRGPAGTAVRTGELCLIRDIQSEFFTPWRDLAIQKGYKTIICLPLKIEGSTFGVLAIYSNEVDIFDNKEVDILKELSADLSFGLRSLRLKVERDLAEKSLRYSEFVTTIMNQISNSFIKYSDDEIYSKVLDIIMRIINCDFGLFGYIDPNFDLIIPTMTKNIWDKCEIENKSIVFPQNSWGNSIWGKSIKDKETIFSAGQFHTPSGHVSINNFISVPIVFNDKTIGLISLANSLDDFTEENINLLKNISNYISPILQARLQRDEQDKKRIIAEEEISKLSKGIEQSPLSIVITDKDGILEYVNPKFCEITGYDKSEVIGKNPRILKSNYNNLIDYKLLWETITSGKVWNGEFYNKKKNGEYYWESAFIAPIINSSNEITHYIALKEDITEKKKLMDELVSSKEKAEESDRLKSAFLANMSHEIRTPINGIIGFSKILSEPNLTDYERTEFSEILKNSCQRLINTINDIIDLSKIEVGQMIVKKTNFNINKLIEELYEFHSMNFKTANVEFNYFIDPPIENILIFSDEQKIYQIFNNLISNAFKFTPKGKVDFGCLLKGDYIEFYVHDTGIGISNDKLDFVFGRFNQENISLSRDYEGFGLGLPITKGLLELLGSKINVISEKGKGSTFSFSLKLVNSIVKFKKLNKQNSSKKIFFDFRDKTILIAEDDIVNFKLLKRILEKNTNAKIIHVENGFKAVELVKINPEISLIIMDIKMPVMNGYEATKRIREFNINIPIIALTAFALAGDREKALDAGCNDYLAKPYEIQIFIKLVDKYLK